jgi:hypothetical protein
MAPARDGFACIAPHREWGPVTLTRRHPAALWCLEFMLSSPWRKAGAIPLSGSAAAYFTAEKTPKTDLPTIYFSAISGVSGRNGPASNCPRSLEIDLPKTAKIRFRAPSKPRVGDSISSGRARRLSTWSRARPSRRCRRRRRYRRGGRPRSPSAAGRRRPGHSRRCPRTARPTSSGPRSRPTGRCH